MDADPDLPDDKRRTRPQRRADALTDICRHYLRTHDTQAPTGGRRGQPHISGIVNVERLAEHTDPTTSPTTSRRELDFTGPLSTATRRRFTCDCTWRRVIMHGRSEVLDVGRATRTVPGPLWRALVARDRHCTHRGCTTPAAFCDAHTSDTAPTAAKPTSPTSSCSARATTANTTNTTPPTSPPPHRPGDNPPTTLAPDHDTRPWRRASRSAMLRHDREAVMYKQIVVGTDGSASARVAVDAAIELAALTGARLHVVHAHNVTRASGMATSDIVLMQGVIAEGNDAARDDGQRICTEVVTTAADAGVEADAHCVGGNAVDALVRVATDTNADLIVVGNRGMTGARRFVLGSVPDKVAHRCPTNVLIVDTREPR